MTLPAPELRLATALDAPEVAEISLVSFKATYGWPPVHTDDEVRSWVRDVLLPSTETWVATAPDGRLVGFMSLKTDELDQLWLLPDHTGQGLGSRFVALAKELRPAGLSLFTFQVNTGARRFYERHGFRVVDLNEGERNEERKPDIRYAWVPTT